MSTTLGKRNRDEEKVAAPTAVARVLKRQKAVTKREQQNLDLAAEIKAQNARLLAADPTLETKYKQKTRTSIR